MGSTRISIQTRQVKSETKGFFSSRVHLYLLNKISVVNLHPVLALERIPGIYIATLLYAAL
jgi:hypothetical protein